MISWLETDPKLVLLVHAFSTWAMFGVIWVVQLAIYPLFSRIGSGSFCRYEQSYTSSITWVVLPLMTLELGTGVILALHPGFVPLNIERYSGVFLLVVIWLSTFMVQVPLHHSLTRGFSNDAHQKLVKTNWIRTIAWSVRSLLVVAMIYAYFGS
jgi:hypothetical protein